MTDTLVFGGLIPVFIAVATVFCSRRMLPASAAQRYALAIGFSTAFFAGTMMIPALVPAWPSSFWHWLPYLGALAAFVGPIGLADGITAFERCLLQLLLAAFSAWLLVPTWESLEPSRLTYFTVASFGLFALMVLLDPLCSRLPGPYLLVPFVVVAMTAVPMVAVFGNSVKFAQLAGVATAALAGCWIATTLRGGEIVVRGLIPGYVIVVGGVGFAGCIYPDPPVVELLLVPAAPLALWVCACRPLARLRGTKARIVQMTAVLVPVLTAAITLMIDGQPGGEAGF